jgi:hypothetical protein
LVWHSGVYCDYRYYNSSNILALELALSCIVWFATNYYMASYGAIDIKRTIV